MKELIPTIILSGLTAALTWIFARKKNTAELNKIEMDTEKVESDIETAGITNLRSLIAIYKEISEDLKRELTQVHDECLALRKEVQELRKENQHLKVQLEILNGMINKK